MPATKIKNILYRILLPICAYGCGPDPITAVSGHPLNDYSSFLRLIRKHHVLGSATLLHSGKDCALILTRSDKPSHIATESTYFRVASITKTATSVLTLKLCEMGLFELDRPVGNYLSGMTHSPVLKDMTLRHLLSHTSGLVDPPTLEKDVESGKPFPDLMKEAFHHSPGTSFHYSNLGFGLIGCIMEAVLNQPVSTIFQDYLFTPLAMNATLEGCRIPAEQIMPVTRLISRQRLPDLVLTRLGRVPLEYPDPLRHYGHTAGSMYSDIKSIHTLLQTLICNGKHFLSDHSLQEIKKQHAAYGRLSPSLSYGLGLLMIRDPSLSESRILGHQGFAYGCADGAFWEESTGRIMITLNGGCSEARHGRLGLANEDFLRFAFRKELPKW